MAYVLGFFAADGNMIRNKRGAHFIKFYNCDRKLLACIRSVLKSNHKIGIHTQKRHIRQNITYQLQIGSKELFSDLLSLDMSPAKSKILRLPKIPPRFHGDFVRGYFDGDGCIYFNKIKFAARKNPRNILMVKFTSGSKLFLTEIHALLKLHGVAGGSVRQKWNKTGFDLTLSHRDSVALFHLMYDTVPDSGLYLARKYHKFTHAIQALYGKMRS